MEKTISQLKKKFNFQKGFKSKGGRKKIYHQIAHTSSKRSAEKLKKKAEDKGYETRRVFHGIKGDPHHDVYVRKDKKRKKTKKKSNLPKNYYKKK